MKRVQQDQKSQRNRRGLDEAEINSALDDLIRTFEDSNRKLTELLARAKA